MKEHFVIDPLIGKRAQLMLATQLCRLVLKVCARLTPDCKLYSTDTSQVNNVIIAGEDEEGY